VAIGGSFPTIVDDGVDEILGKTGIKKEGGYEGAGAASAAIAVDGYYIVVIFHQKRKYLLTTHKKIN